MQNRYYGKRKLLDDTFNLEKSYFYQELSSSEFDSIKKFINWYFTDRSTDQDLLKTFFSHYPVLKKGEQNLKKLRQAIQEIAKQHKDAETFFDSYTALNDFIQDQYMAPKPAIMEVLFFPNLSNENKVANMIRTCKQSLNIAIFTITNDKLTAAIEEVYERGVKIRIITDDECCKNLGSDIYRLAAMVEHILIF
jgi:hypothetical protein